MAAALAFWLASAASAQEAFQQAGVLPDAYSAHALEAANGYLYHVGGISATEGILDGDRVYFARINAPGQLGPWTETTRIPVPVFYHASAVHNGFVYVIGGYKYDAAFTVSRAVYFARLQADGSVGAWTRAADLPASLYLHSAAAWDGMLYVTGGWSETGLENGVYGGRIQADGSIGSWTPLAPLPTGVYAHTAVQSGTVYVIGGSVDEGTRITDAVYYARIQPDKTLAPWQSGAPLPQPLANHVAEVVRGRIWTVGGWTENGSTTRVDSSAILADRSLGPWEPGPRMPVALYQHASAVWDDVLYVSGGSDGNTNRNEVWYKLPPAPVQQPDQLPPRTTLALSGPRYGSEPVFVSRAAAFALSAVDDRATVGDADGVGVASTQWAAGSGPFAAYSAPFSLAQEGAYYLRYFSTDSASHVEPEQALAVALDATAPASSLAAGSPKAVLSDGRVVVSAATALAVSAADPLSGGVASGVAEVSSAVDGAALGASPASFTLPAVDGAHAVRHQARDRVGNEEALKTSTVYLDATAPVSALSASPAPYQSAAGMILGASGLLSFTAQDPAAGGVAAGVNRTEYRLDGAAAVPVAGPLALAEGSHVLGYRSLDNVGNAEAWREAAYSVDATAPSTTLAVGSPVMRVDGRDVVTPETPITLSAADPAVAGVSTGVASTAYRVDAGAEQPYAAAFRLPAGSHTVYYRSTDNAGNREPERSVVFSVEDMDALPPRTSHQVLGPQAGSEPVYLAPSSRLVLASADDRVSVGDAAGVGVASVQFAFDAAAFAAYGSTLPAPAEGSRWLRYYAADRAGNVEAAKALWLAVDATLPASSVSIGQPQAVLADGRVIVASATWLSASAADPASAGVASGVAELRVGVDGGELAAFAGAFRLPGTDGPHAVRTQAIDRVGNLEPVRTLTVLVDRTAPVSTLEPASGLLGASGVLELSAADPAAGGVAAGVNRVEYRVDGGDLRAVAGALVLPEGAHALLYRALDNVGNSEDWRESAYTVDATAPATTLVIGSPVMRVDGRDVVTADTPLSLSAEDPLSSGVASGILRTLYRIDDGPEAAYSEPFKLASGSHVVRFRSLDRAGNAEAERSAELSVDAMDSLPPRTEHSISGPSYGADPVFVSAASRFLFAATDDRRTVGDAAGVGVEATLFAVDNGVFAAATGPVAAGGEGSRWLRYFSTDRAGNAETARAVLVAVDATKPASRVELGSPRATLASGAVVVATHTLLALSAEDPEAAGVSSGIGELSVSLDGGAWAAREGLFALGGPDGTRIVATRAADRVGNAEEPRSLTLLVDGTAPVSELAPTVAPYADAGGPILGAAAELSFSASDPVVNGVAAGLARVEYRLDGAAAAAAASTLVLSEGAHRVERRATDNVGNAEPWRQASYRVDATAPLTALEIGSPVMRLDGRDVVTPETPIALQAQDPVSSGVASGVKATPYRIDGGAEQAYSGPFRLPAGEHTVSYRSLDNAGNAEAERSVTFQVQDADVAAARTALSVVGPSAGADPLFVSPASRFALSAADDLKAAGDAAGVGVEASYFAFDAAAFAAYSGPFAPAAEGSRWLRYYSVDRAGNAEEPAARLVAVDATAPVSELQVGGPKATLASGQVVVSTAALLAASALDPEANGVASGVAEVLVGVDGALPSARAGAFAPPAADGLHALAYAARDRVGNLEAARSLVLGVDANAPATAIVASPAAFPSAEGPILGAASELSFEAADAAVNGVAAGVHRTEYSLDGGPVLVGTTTLVLAEGAHVLRFRSVDNVANEEAWKALELKVDATPPLTTLEVGSPVMRLDGQDVLTPDTPLSFSAADPVSGGVASGVGAVFYRVDGGPEIAYGGEFRLAAGRHVLRYRSTDRAGNAEAEREAVLAVETLDRLPPRTAFEVHSRSYGSEPMFVTPDSRFSLAAEDDRVEVGDKAGVGVESTRWAFDDGELAGYSGPFGLPGLGRRWLRFASSDRLGNTEAAAAVELAVDGAAPVSELSIGAPSALLESGEAVVAPQTRISLSAADPLVEGVAVGVKSLEVSIDGGAFAAAPASLGLPAADGPHSVRWLARDHLDNAEAERSATIHVDATAPSAAISASPAYSGAGGIDLGAASLVSLSADDPVVNGSAAGVHHVEVSIDGAEPASSAASFGLEEGVHAVRARAVDNVGNVGGWSEESFRVDLTAPITTVQTASPVMRLFDLDVVTPETAISLSAEDPASGGVASGVRETLYRVDGGPERAYAGPFRLAAGSRSVAYRSVDNAGNSEEERTIGFQVGNLLSDSVTAVDAVALSGGAVVTGRVRAGGAFSAGGNKTSVQGDVVAASIGLSGKASVSGAKTEAAGTVAAPSAAAFAAAAAAANDNGAVPWLSDGRLVLSGEARTLPAGSYYVSELKLDSWASLSIAGPVALFVAGNVAVSGGSTINPGGSADDLWIVTSGSSVAVSGQGRFAAQLIAPEAAVSLSGGGMAAGRLLGRTVTLTGHSAHPSDAALPARTRGGRARRLAKAEAKGESPASAARGSRGAERVVSSRLGDEAPAGQRLARDSSARPGRSKEELPAAEPAVSRIASSARKEPAASAAPASARPSPKPLARSGGARAELAATKPEAKVGGDAKAAAPASAKSELRARPAHERRALAKLRHEPAPAVAVRPAPKTLKLAVQVAERSEGFAAPAPGAASASRSSRRLESDALPPQPRAQGGVRERLEHRGRAEALARPVPAAASPATGASLDGRVQAVASARLEPLEPEARGLGRAERAEPGPLDGLPAAPKGRAVLERLEHAGEAVALERPSTVGGRGTGGPARMSGDEVAVLEAALEAREPEARADAQAAAPKLPAPAPRVRPGRSVPSKLPPLMLAKAAALSFVAPDEARAVRSSARTGVVVPEGAVEAPIGLTVADEERVAGEERERRERAAERREARAVGVPVSYGPEGTRFKKPVTLELAYDRAKLPAGVSEGALAVHYWNPQAGEWQPLPSRVDRQAQIVRAQTDHFSTYQLLASAGAPSQEPAARGALLGEVYAYPNPVSRGQTPRIRVESAADRVEIRVYDVSGELKHSAAYDNPQADLEHSWDVSGVGSGVYVYAVTASRAGERPARAKGKLGVIR